MMQFVVIVIIFGENVNIIFIVYEDCQIIKRNSHVFSHVSYVVTLPSFNFSSVLFSRTILTSTNSLLIWFVRSKQNASVVSRKLFLTWSQLEWLFSVVQSQDSRRVLSQLKVSSKPKASEMCLACTWILTCVVAWLCFEISFFLLSADVFFVVIDGNIYLNFGIISKSWKCSYLLSLLNGYVADRVKQVELSLVYLKWKVYRMNHGSTH